MIQQLLLVGQVALLVLLYLFIWRVMRTARSDLASPGQAGRHASAQVNAPQDSTIIPAADAARARAAAGLPEPRIVVLASDVLRSGVPFRIGEGLTIGRDSESNTIVLNEATVSSRHARLQPPSTLVDLDSTNGTLVNGAALHGRVRLRPGDTFAIGSTTFRYEVPS